MAMQLPTALKTPEVQPFATRAAQLEKFKPIVSYWLEYYILQHILTNALHNGSSEVSAYAAQLMDKAEATKTHFPDEPAINDDVVAQAYMEQFAAETLARADKAQFDNAVTRQTGDTLLATATFYESTSIWNELSAETHARIKYAKYHARRILLALKNGQDPNETNPKAEPAVVADTDDAEIQDEFRRLEQNAAAQPTVEDADDADAPASVAAAAVSPLAPTPDIPVVPASDPGYFPSPATPAPAVTQPEIKPVPVVTYPSGAPTSQAPSITTSVASSSTPAAQAPTTGFNIDDDAVIAAQKHAKWAISALNFEDVPTAVRELRAALVRLGGM